MIYLIASILSSLSILIFFKFFERLKINNYLAIAMNYLVAASFGLLQTNTAVDFTHIAGAPWFGYALIMGVFFLAGFIFIAFSTQSAGMAITSVASNLSIVIPVSIALLFFGENINWQKATGLAMAVVSIYLIFKPGKGSRLNMNNLLYPIMLFVIVGTNNTLMKVSERHGAADEYMLFLSIIFGVAFILSLLYFIPSKKIKSINASSLIGGAFLGLLNYYSTLFMLQALTIYDSSIYFPIYNLSYISLAALVGYVFFRENLKKENWVGIAIAALAIAFITAL